MAQPVRRELVAALDRCRVANCRLVVAVSGGPDSLALTLGLAELRSTLDLDLHLAHFNHQLRPESEADAAFVENVGRSFGLPTTIGDANIQQLATANKRGIEETARRERYRFLAQVCRETWAAGVVVAHTADDQTETRLMHWLRGSGLRGLVGMEEDLTLEIPGVGQVRLIRPLLGVRREDTVAFCEEHKLTPRIDPSNLDPRFTRNRVRHEVVPCLRAINPGLDNSLARLARSAADAEQFIDAELDRRMPELAACTTSGWIINRAACRALPAALKRALFQRAAAALVGSGNGTHAENVEDAMRAADSWPAGTVLAWPGELEVSIEHENIVIRRGRIAIPPLKARDIPLSIDGSVEIGPLAPAIAGRPGLASRALLQLRRQSAPCEDRRGDRLHCDLDGAKLAQARSLAVRSRQPGDWIMPEGMAGRKKLQDLLVDAHVPREERDNVPVIATPEGIAWVVGVRRDRRLLAGPESRGVVCLAVDPTGESAWTS